MVYKNGRHMQLLCRFGIRFNSSHWPCVTDNSGLSTYGLNGQWKRDEHPAYTPSGVWPPLPLPLQSLMTNFHENQGQLVAMLIFLLNLFQTCASHQDSQILIISSLYCRSLEATSTSTNFNSTPNVTELPLCHMNRLCICPDNTAMPTVFRSCSVLQSHCIFLASTRSQSGKAHWGHRSTQCLHMWRTRLTQQPDIAALS